MCHVMCHSFFVVHWLLYIVLGCFLFCRFTQCPSSFPDSADHSQTAKMEPGIALLHKYYIYFPSSLFCVFVCFLMLLNNLVLAFCF